MERCAWHGISPIGWKSFSALPVSRTRKSRNAIWIWRMPCSIVSKRCSFIWLNELHKRVPVENLAMAGGCALNSVANGNIFTGRRSVVHGFSQRQATKAWQSAPHCILIIQC